MIILSCQGASLYTIYFGITFSIQQIGLESINLNGVLFGFCQSLGYVIVIPFIHKMRRKFWGLVFQTITLIGIAILFGLSFCQDTQDIKILRSGVSTFVLTIMNSTQSAVFFLSVSELFPSRIRGTAAALIMFFCKITASFAPLMSSVSTSYGFHVMVGCSLWNLVAYPLSFLQSETLFLQENNDNERYVSLQEGYGLFEDLIGNGFGEEKESEKCD